MAHLPSPEENARKVLSIYAHFQSRIGDALRSNNFLAVAVRRHIPISDIQDGLEYAVDAHWLERTDTGAMKLTQEGFKEMPEPGYR